MTNIDLADSISEKLQLERWARNTPESIEAARQVHIERIVQDNARKRVVFHAFHKPILKGF